MLLRRWAGSQDEKERIETERETAMRKYDGDANMMNVKCRYGLDGRNEGMQRDDSLGTGQIVEWTK